MKTAVITGASRGVGAAAAERFAKEGYRLILNCRKNFERLDQLAEKLSAFTEATVVHGPLTDEALSENMRMDLDGFSRTKEEILLINNAGISTFNTAQSVSDTEFAEMLENNLGTMFRLTRAMIPYMLKTGNGRIINISSVWGNEGAAMESIYSMTKGGVNAFTRALGRELAPEHIPVNALALGCVDTDMNGWMGEDDRKTLEDEIPYGRMAKPEEVAEALLALSRMPKYLTAQVITFDGAWT